MKLLVLSLIIAFSSCGGGTTPPPEPPAPPWTCELPYPGCHETGASCSSPDAQCWHNPTTNPEHCEEAPLCDQPPTPTPPEPNPVPPVGNQWFPIVPQDQITAVRGNPGRNGTALNRAMADLTGCVVGQEPCPISLPVDLWFQAVCRQLHVGVTVGDETALFFCGFHIAPPLGRVCPPGGGCSDQISVKRESFCDGGFHENYRVISPDHQSVRWYPSATLDAWNVDCTGATWPSDPSEPPAPEPPAPEPPSDNACMNPDPTGLESQFVMKPHGAVWDTTYRVKSWDYCNAAGFTDRTWCPLRNEGDPEREACEAKHVGVQQWWCNGENINTRSCDEFEGECVTPNPAQAKCQGLARTCTEDGRTCEETSW